MRIILSAMLMAHLRSTACLIQWRYMRKAARQHRANQHPLSRPFSFRPTALQNAKNVPLSAI
jgi:hypothetical protein